MYYLKKCKRVACTRHGNVALSPQDEYCNIHLPKEKEEEKEDQNKNEEVE